MFNRRTVLTAVTVMAVAPVLGSIPQTTPTPKTPQEIMDAVKETLTVDLHNVCMVASTEKEFCEAILAHKMQTRSLLDAYQRAEMIEGPVISYEGTAVLVHYIIGPDFYTIKATAVEASLDFGALDANSV